MNMTFGTTLRDNEKKHEMERRAGSAMLNPITHDRKPHSERQSSDARPPRHPAKPAQDDLGSKIRNIHGPELLAGSGYVIEAPSASSPAPYLQAWGKGIGAFLKTELPAEMRQRMVG